MDSRLKYTLETVFRVSFIDLEELIEAVYGVRMSIPVDQDVTNGTAFSVEVNLNTMSKSEMEQCVGQIMEGGDNTCLALGGVMHDLARARHLDEGDYMIDVYW